MFRKNPLINGWLIVTRRNIKHSLLVGQVSQATLPLLLTESAATTDHWSNTTQCQYSQQPGILTRYTMLTVKYQSKIILSV